MAQPAQEVHKKSSEQRLPGSFLTLQQVRHIQREFGTPVYVYDMETLIRRAQTALSMPHAFGLTVRYAMKANPTGAILQLFDRLGLYIDASSGYEARRALHAGIAPEKIQLTAQEAPAALEALVRQGVRFNATSLHQLTLFGQLFPGHELSIRINPGLGSGSTQRTNVGGPAASFGIWHEYLPQVERIRAAHDLRITRLHSHIGSGADPAIYQRCAALTLRAAHTLPDVHTVNLGGGFKIARMPGEQDTDLHAVGHKIADQFRRFQEEDAQGRQLHLEIEPGTFLVAHAGAIIATIVDVKDTGAAGYRFIVVDSGMTEILRPGLYGAQHPLYVVPASDEPRGEETYLVSGHCCESGDTLTPAPGEPEALQPRRLTTSRIGDALVIGGSGAYAAAMSAANYNSFPRAAELLLTPGGELYVIRERQRLADMIAAERLPDLDSWPVANASAPDRKKA